MINLFQSKSIWLERIGCAMGWLVAFAIWITLSMFDANADVALTPNLPFITLSMLVATVIGAFGSFLAFGADKKFPPSTTSIGHILLGFGAGLFFTRGSLELMGNLESSDNIVVFVSFLWAVAGYFFLRLVVSVVESEPVAKILPAWLSRIFGGDK